MNNEQGFLKSFLDELYDFLRSDLVPGLLNVDRWKALSHRSLRLMNRRTKFGFLWVILSATIFVVSIGLVYSFVFQIEIESFLPYVACGYITWSLIASALVSAPSIFTSYKNYISQRNLPLTVYVTSSAYDKVIVFLTQSSVIVITCVIFSTGLSASLLILPVSLLLIFVTAIGVSLSLGVMAVRYRDLGQVISSSILIIFLLTPIIWKPEFAAERRAMLVDVNPFYHFVHIIRGPIIYQEIPVTSLIVAAVISILSLIIGSSLMAVYRHRIIYWL